MFVDKKIVSMPDLILSPTPESNCTSSLDMLVIQHLVCQSLILS